MKRWAKNFDKCKRCNTKKYKHKGHGFCTKCHYEWRYYKDNKLKNLLIKSAKKYYLKNKNNPEWIKRHTESAKRYQANKPEHSKIKHQRTKNFKRYVLEDREHTGNGLEIVCPNCGEKVKSQIKVDNLKNNVKSIRLFTEMLKKYHPCKQK